MLLTLLSFAVLSLVGASASQTKLQCWGISTFVKADNVPADALWDATDISAAGEEICALKDGALHCWGDCYNDKCNVPTSGVGPILSFHMGSNNVCAQFETVAPAAPGTVLKCWGATTHGATTVPAALEYNTLKYACGGGQCCGVDNSNVGYCWGQNHMGQATVPADLGSVSDIHPSWAFTCAITTAGAVRCWGDDRTSTGIPRNPTFPGPVQTLDGGHAYICAAFTENGALSADCVGGSTMVDYVPASIAGLTSGKLNTFAAGGRGSCFVTDQKDLACKGSTTWCGAVPHLEYPVLKLATGYDFTCGLLDVSTTVTTTAVFNPSTELVCWGDHVGVSAASVPASVKYNAKEVSASDQHTVCAIGGEGQVSCWGCCEDGQCLVPTDVGPARTVSVGSVCNICGIFETLPPAAAGTTIRCWGCGSNGAHNIDPAFDGTAVKISAGGEHTCVVDGNKVPGCWGLNNYNQATIPGDVSTVEDIEASWSWTCVITETALALRCWGGTRFSIPDNPTMGGPVLSIESGVDYVCAVVSTASGPNFECKGRTDMVGSLSPPAATAGSAKFMGGSNNDMCFVHDVSDVVCQGGRTWAPLTPTFSHPIAMIATGQGFGCAILEVSTTTTTSTMTASTSTATTSSVSSTSTTSTSISTSSTSTATTTSTTTITSSSSSSTTSLSSSTTTTWTSTSSTTSQSSSTTTTLTSTSSTSITSTSTTTVTSSSTTSQSSSSTTTLTSTSSTSITSTSTTTMSSSSTSTFSTTSTTTLSATSTTTVSSTSTTTVSSTSTTTFSGSTTPTTVSTSSTSTSVSSSTSTSTSSATTVSSTSTSTGTSTSSSSRTSSSTVSTSSTSASTSSTVSSSTTVSTVTSTSTISSTIAASSTSSSTDSSTTTTKTSTTISTTTITVTTTGIATTASQTTTAPPSVSSVTTVISSVTSAAQTTAVATVPQTTVANSTTRVPTSSTTTTAPPAKVPAPDTTAAPESVRTTGSSTSTHPNTTTASQAAATVTDTTLTGTTATGTTATATTSTAAGGPAFVVAKVQEETVAAIADILTQVEEEVESLLEDFAESNRTTILSNVTGGVLAATKLDFATFSDEDYFSITVSDGEQEAPDGEAARKVETEVKVPRSLYQFLRQDLAKGDGLVLTVKTFDEGGESSPVVAMSSRDEESGSFVEVKAAVAIDLSTLRGKNIEVNNLTQPVTFSMPVTYTKGMMCAFWDEEKKLWSTDGVSVNSKAVAEGDLICDTWHLSLFGAIFQGFLDALLCSQLTLFNSKAFNEMLYGDWKTSPGSVLFWLLLAIMGTVFCVAAYFDWKREQRFNWSPEFFLLPRNGRNSVQTAPEPLPTVIEEDEEDTEELYIHKGFLYWVMAYVIACVTACCACCRENALRDAVDEIVSEWFENFGELRTLGESIWDSMEIGAISAGRFCHMSKTVMSRLVLTSSRRLAAASMGVNGHVVNFVLDDQEMRGILMERHARRSEEIRRSAMARREQAATRAEARAEGVLGPKTSEESVPVPEPRADWRLCTTRNDAWAALHEEVCDQIEKHVSRVGWWALPYKVWVIFSTNNPLGTIFAHNIFMSCKMMAFMRILELSGELMVLCIFFDASGGASPKDNEEECGGGELSETMGYKLGRILAIATGSILLAGLPVMLLHSLHTRHFKYFDTEGCPQWKRQLRAWKIQDAVIWVVGSAYLAFALLFISLFLANIDVDGHMDWTETGAFTLFQDAIVVPLSVALIMPMLCSMLITCISVAARIDQTALIREVHHRLHESTNVMLPIVMV